MIMTGQTFNFIFFKVGLVVGWNQFMWRTSESKMRTRMTVQDPRRTWVKRVVWGISSTGA
jgi:hypothetical protein